MEKKTINKFGEHYLLGKGKDGQLYWLEKESWDCNWYWGFGYIQTYTNNRQPTRSVDINSHQHFDSLFLRGPENGHDMFKQFFAETVLNKDEIWELVDLMQTYYSLKTAAAVFNHGHSHYTDRASIGIVKNKELEDKVNKELLPEVFKRIRTLLTE